MLFSLALVPVVFTTQADANKDANISRSVGSTPSPTPDGIRIPEGRVGQERKVELVSLIGRPVFSQDGYLGTVTDVDTDRNFVAVRSADDRAVALSPRNIYYDRQRVLAPSISKSEFEAMPAISDSEFTK
jgi:hypothetical protein